MAKKKIKNGKETNKNGKTTKNGEEKMGKTAKN